MGSVLDLLNDQWLVDRTNQHMPLQQYDETFVSTKTTIEVVAVQQR